MMERSGAGVRRQAESGVGSEEDVEVMSKWNVSGAESSKRSPGGPVGPVGVRRRGPITGSGTGCDTTTKEDHAEELAVLDQDAVKMQRQVTQARSRETRAKAQIEDSESANRELKQQQRRLQRELNQTKHLLSEAKNDAAAQLAVS